MRTGMTIGIYLAAIVAANIAAATFGPAVTPVTAFALIGLDLVARDELHQRWQGRGLWWRMAALIAAGSLLAYIINPATAQIALASCLAFAAAGCIDAVAFHALQGHPWMVRSNGSNVPSAIADSFIFPAVAFGAFLPGTVLLQVIAKIAGGMLWSYIYGLHKTARTEDA